MFFLNSFFSRRKFSGAIRWVTGLGLVAIFVCFPAVSFAQVVQLSTGKTTYQAGDSFAVNLLLDTRGQSINTISGAVVVPPNLFQIVDVRSGSSIVSLWVERPAINYATGRITFTGGIPGGYAGSNGPILSFGVRAKTAGKSALRVEDIKLLLNDGQGTELSNVSAPALSLTITAASPKPASPSAPKAGEPAPKEEYRPTADTVPPESFVPLVSRHPSIANDSYFVSFFAVDKDSGIDRYEISEKPFLAFWAKDQWVRSESPYVLREQWWRTTVTVRAYDQAGNYQDAVTVKEFHPYVQVAGMIFLGILLVVGTAVIMYRVFVIPLRRRASKFTRNIK